MKKLLTLFFGLSICPYFAAFSTKPIGALGLNPRVQTLALQYPIQAQLIYQAGNEANAYTDQYFGTGAQNQNDNSSNAFRHAVWNALSIKKIREATGSTHASAAVITQLLTSAYEYDDTGTFLVKNAASAMDLHNNLVGRSFTNYSTTTQLLDSLYLKSIEPKVNNSTLSQILASHDSNEATAWNLLENTTTSTLPVATALVRLDTCTVLLLLNHPIANTVKFEVSQYIQAQNTLMSSANVIYDAKNYILLQPGFKAETGCIFLAYPDGCGNN